MSVDMTSGSQGGGQILTDEDVIALARAAIEASRDEIRRGRDGVDAVDLQQPGVTVDLGHKNIIRLPDEVVDIIKDEIERLAISHNRVSSFPARLSECKRLRYLNVRYNQLKEVPKPILQLSSLEILDISRNRLRFLPEEISNLTSLKVLAIQRNKIERLPLCLGDMNSLRMLKLDDNPLVFPPPEVWRPESFGAVGVGAEAETQATIQIKKYLRQKLSANSTRQRLQVESDSDQSEDAVETPRAPRPGTRARFPVRPSITGLDALGIPNSISPEVVPPVPGQLHSRMRSTHTPRTSRQLLLSPPNIEPSRSFSSGDLNGEITVRPKRHGIITPRVTEAPKNAFRAGSTPPIVNGIASAFNSPESRSSSRQAKASPAMAYLKEIGASTCLSAQILGGDMLSLYESVKWSQTRSQNTTPSEFPELIKILKEACQQHMVRLSEFERDEKKYLIDRNVDKFVMRQAADPIRDDVVAIRLLARMTNKHKSQIAWQCNSKAIYRAMYYKFFEVGQHLAVAAKLFKHMMMYPSDAYFAGTTMISSPLARPNRLRGSIDDGQQLRLGPALNTGSNLTSPTPSMTSFGQVPWANGDMNQPFAQQSSSNRMQVPSTDDILFDNIITCMYTVVSKCNDGLGRINNHLVLVRQELESLYGERNAQYQALGNLIKLFGELMGSIMAMGEQLPANATSRPELRDSPEFWAIIRKPLRDWSTWLEQARSLNPSPIGGPIKGVTKTLHLAIKDASSAIANSPWTSASTALPPNMLGAHRKNPSGGSVPSTPLSAALGPAAQATMPTGAAATNGVMPGVGLAGQRMTAGSRINFFERVDRFERETRQAGTGAFGYGKRY